MDQIANQLYRFGEDVDNFNSYYRKLVQDMQSVVSNMNSLNNSWDGEAHEALMNSFEQDRKKIQTMIDAIGRISENMSFADGEYNSCESAVAGIISQIQA